MKFCISLLAAGSLIALATAASAGNQEQTFSLSPMVGGITFDGKQHLQTRPVLGVRFGYNITKSLGAEILFDYAGTKGTQTGRNVDFFRYGAQFLYHFMPDNKLVPYLATGIYAVDYRGDTASASHNKGRGAFDYGVGLKYYLNDNIALRADVRHIMFTHGAVYHTIEYMAGIHIPLTSEKPPVKPVEVVAQPKAAEPVVQPEPPKPVEPPPPAPSVPTSSLTANPASIVKGQPSALSWTSNNTSDCTIQPGIGKVNTQGSMSITPGDTTAYTLNCTGPGGNTSSNASVSVTIPPPPVVVAAQPKASAAAVKAAERFCNKPAIITIEFDTNKADIKPKYETDLKILGLFLTEYPKAKGEISGHTDNVGSKELNNKLSQRRADSVKTYLVKKNGIEESRISTKGYGFSKPVASNKTKAGKAKNRRIETNFICD